MSGSPHPGLYLVKHEQNSSLVTESANSSKDVVVRFVNSTLSLDRLDKHCGGIFV